MTIKKPAPSGARELLRRTAPDKFKKRTTVPFMCSTKSARYLIQFLTDTDGKITHKAEPIGATQTSGATPTAATSDITQVELDLSSSSFNGCPQCDNRGTFFCSCGTLSCMRPIDTTHTCPACNQHAKNLVSTTTVTGSRETNRGIGQERRGRLMHDSTLRIEAKK